VKDDLGVKTLVVYSICSKCYHFYIGWIGQCTETRVKEHCQLFQLGQPDNLAVAEYMFNQDHHIQLQDTKIFSAKPGCMDYFIREAPEKEFHPNSMNRKNGMILHVSWELLILSLRA
jgi:hypothetical protein